MSIPGMPVPRYSSTSASVRGAIAANITTIAAGTTAGAEAAIDGMAVGREAAMDGMAVAAGTTMAIVAMAAARIEDGDTAEPIGLIGGVHRQISQFDRYAGA